MSIGLALGLHLGRSGKPFDPRSLGNLALWLAASRIAGSDGDAVTTWADASGNGKDATQATAGKKPTYRTAGINGRPSVEFDGGDGLATAAIDLTGTLAATAFAVVLATGAGATQIIAEFGPNVTDTTAWSMFRTSANQLEARISGDVGLSRFLTTGTIITTAKTVSAVMDKSIASSEATVWIDGATAGTRPVDSNNTNAYGNRVVNVGARDINGVPAVQFVGHIGEFLLYARALSTAERQSIEAYLKAKWGTA